MRFTLVDALRGIAALSVLLFHAFAGGHTPLLHSELPPLVQWPLKHGNLGVSIFFVLSGSVITHSLLDLKLTPPMVGRFMLRRSLRLDPPYWLMIALGCIMALVKGEPSFTVPQIAAHLIYAQDLIGTPPINTVFWTLCLEVQFYLVFALLLLCGSRAVLLAAFVASIPLSQLVIWHGLFTSLWYGFLLGVGAYMSWKGKRLVGWFLLYAAILAALAIVRHDLFMISCAATACLILSFAYWGRLTTAVNWRPLQFLGAISYSLYLIHNPVIGVTFRILPKFIANGLIAEVAGYGASVAASIIAATAMWLMIERPSMKLSRLISLKPMPDQQSVELSVGLGRT